MDAVVFMSKVDLGLVLVLLATIALVAFVVWRALLVVDDRTTRWLMAIVTIGCSIPALVIPVWVFIGTSYTFIGSDLVIRSGPARWDIPVASIEGLTPTRNLRSSPALSLDRLQIDYGDGERVLVSPKDKDAFLAELERRRAAD